MRWTLLALMACKSPVADVVVLPGLIEAEVLDYDYAFDVATGAATSTVTLFGYNDGDCVQLDYAAPEPLACRFDGAAGTCSVQDAVIEVCGTPVPAGELSIAVDLVVPEQTIGDSDVGYDTSTTGDHYMVSWVGGCSQFGPCDADPGVFATYRFTVDHDPGDTLLCSGDLDPGDTRSACTFDYAGGPTYSTFGFAVSSRWTRRDIGPLAGIDVQFYDLPVAQSTLVDTDVIEDALVFMEEWVGPYPYGDSLRFFAVDSYWAGFEHPGNVGIAAGLRPNSTPWFRDLLTQVMVHEIVHMWAGNQTTLATARDFAWKESVAEYVSWIVTGEERQPEYWKAISRNPAHYPFPEEDGLHPFDWYGDSYGPGPMILFRQLEGLYGREPILEALSGFLGEEGVAGVDEVRAALEATTGADLEGYFDTWAIGSGRPQWPRLDVDVNGLELTVTQVTSDGEAWPCAFHLLVTDGDGTTQELEMRIDVGSEETSATVTLDGLVEPLTVEVDPYSEALIY